MSNQVARVDLALLTPGEVAKIFKVDPKTVTRWAHAGRWEKDDYVRTLGGHFRFRESAVLRLLGLVERGGAEDQEAL
jgi:excisionase family DNA binding protein